MHETSDEAKALKAGLRKHKKKEKTCKESKKTAPQKPLKKIEEKKASKEKKTEKKEEIELSEKEQSMLSTAIFISLLAALLLGIIGAAWLAVDLMFGFSFRETVVSAIDPGLLMVIGGIALLVLLVILGTVYTALKKGSRTIITVIARRVAVIKHGTNTGAKYMTVSSVIFLFFILSGVALYLMDIMTLLSQGSVLGRSIGYWLLVIGGVITILVLIVIVMVFVGAGFYRFFERTMKA